MKVKNLLVVAILAVGLSTANAQQQPGQMPRMNPEEMAARQTEQMTTDLKLDAKQKTEVEVINKKYAQKMGEIFKTNQGNREVVLAKMQEMNTQKNAELEKVLTANQYKLFTEQEKKRQEERRQRMEQRPDQSAPGTEQRGTQRGGEEQ